jgi:uncharacterized protein (TIGR02246 family)
LPIDEGEELPTDSQAIDLLILAWLNAVATGDVDGLAALVTLESRFFPAPGIALDGPDGIRRHYRPIFAGYHVVLTSHPDEISIVGDTAIVLSADRIELTPRGGGRRKVLEGKSMRVLRGGLDGGWRIHRAIENLAPPGNAGKSRRRRS